jgi:hypothetical protein
MNMNLLGIFTVGAGLLGCAAGGETGPDATPPGAEDLIDDLEDGDDAINGETGRMGGWYTFHDDTAGTQVPPDTGFTPIAGGADGSAYAANTSGSGFTEWGAGMGFDLNNPEAVGEVGPRGMYDASRFRGIAFKAKGNVAMRISVETVGVAPTDRGGGCTPSEVMGMECDDLHGKDLALTAEWDEYLVEFAQMRQGGWGLAVPFAATDVTAVLFQVEANLEFDISVDDVRFYE